MKKYCSKLIVYLCCICSFVGCMPAYSQQITTKKTADGKAKRLYDRANEYSKNRLFDKAIKDLESVIKIAPNFIDAHYKLAKIHFSFKQYTEAKKSLEKVIALDKTYKAYALYELGMIHWREDNFAAAAHNFEQFLNVDSRSTKYKTQATRYLANCKFAEEAIKNPVPFDPKALDKSINTPFPEYLPSVTAEGNTLVFTRRIRGDEDVFMSKKEAGQWQTPIPLTNINTPSNEGSQYISADGNLIVFVRCSDRQGYGGCDLYFSEKKGANWTKPENMGQPINTRGFESQPSLSADGNTLYYVSNRKGSLGGRDIWRSRRNENGEWSNPTNLGSKINTDSDDESPFFHPDGQTLYFMSKGHIGMGGFDLFVARRSKLGGWSSPENLGFPINTKGNEGALFLTLDGITTYFTRDNLPEKDAEKLTSRKQADIFTFEMPKALRPAPVTYVKASVKDAKTNIKLANAQIEVIDLLTNEVFSTSKTDSYGSFLTCLPKGGNYALNVNKEHYLFHSENFELLETSSLESPFMLKIKLQPVPKADPNDTPIATEPIILKNVFFESGSNELKASSLLELNRLRDLLVKNTDLSIQINGHTDNVGSDVDNMQLSENRAKAVKDYLIKEGIASDRLSHKGFGESQPIDSNETAEGRKNNRRTEFITL